MQYCTNFIVVVAPWRERTDAANTRKFERAFVLVEVRL